MDDIKVNTLVEYMELISFHEASLFRGVSDEKNHLLIPKGGRNWNAGLDELKKTEKKLIESLKSRAVIYLETPPRNDWEWLIIGQHFGMPTRLLDWTENSLVALYFACAEHELFNGAVYLSDRLPELNPRLVRNPFTITSDYCLYPRHITPRISAQASVFTVSEDPTKPLKVKHSMLDSKTGKKVVSDLRIIITGPTVKQLMLEDLRKIGIGPASLFPGLEGICDQISMEDYFYRENNNKKFRIDEVGDEMIRLSDWESKKRGIA